MEHLKRDLQLIPREAQDCSVLLRNERGLKQRGDNIKRHRRGDVIRQLIEQYDARTIHELQNSLSYNDRWELYNEFGNLWQETAKLGCKCYCENLRKVQETTPFAEYIIQLNHNRVCTHPADTTSGEQWLDKLLEVNRIPKWDILTSLEKIMDKKMLRTNALVIEGPTTTGKSLFVKLVAENYIYGTVQRSGDHSQFFLQNLLDKAVALMEEPRITQLTVNDFKELLGGNPFDIHVKHEPDYRLNRIPVLITTNNPLTTYCNSLDSDAIMKRVLLYKFTIPVGSAILPEPPIQMCTCHFANWFINWKYSYYSLRPSYHGFK